ncbi:hypothetical protein VTO73DRAFT_2103 [Trametes versicolor]
MDNHATDSYANALDPGRDIIGPSSSQGEARRGEAKRKYARRASDGGSTAGISANMRRRCKGQILDLRKIVRTTQTAGYRNKAVSARTAVHMGSDLQHSLNYVQPSIEDHRRRPRRGEMSGDALETQAEDWGDVDASVFPQQRVGEPTRAVREVAVEAVQRVSCVPAVSFGKPGPPAAYAFMSISVRGHRCRASPRAPPQRRPAALGFVHEHASLTVITEGASASASTQWRGARTQYAGSTHTSVSRAREMFARAEPAPIVTQPEGRARLDPLSPPFRAREPGRHRACAKSRSPVLALLGAGGPATSQRRKGGARPRERRRRC